MTPYWLQLLACTGITSIIIYGSIFNRPRGWLKSKSCILSELLKCTLCTGFWVGLIVGYLNNPSGAIQFAFASAAACWLYDSIVGSAQSIEVYFNGKNK